MLHALIPGPFLKVVDDAKMVGELFAIGSGGMWVASVYLAVSELEEIVVQLLADSVLVHHDNVLGISVSYGSLMREITEMLSLYQRIIYNLRWRLLS